MKPEGDEKTIRDATCSACGQTIVHTAEAFTDLTLAADLAWRAYNEAAAPVKKAYEDASTKLWDLYSLALAPLQRARDKELERAKKAYDEALAETKK